MATIRHLSKAPIVEAVIDFRVKSRPDFDAAQLETATANVQNDYPKIEKRMEVEAKITFGKAGSPPVPAEMVQNFSGWRLSSVDELQIAQFRVDGFSFSRLQPYTSWDQIFPEAIRLWKLYADAARPLCATRLAVRYINRFPLPDDIKDYDEYLTAGGRVPEGLPQFVSRFSTQITIHEIESELSATIRQQFQPEPKEGAFSLLLDIDAHINGSFDPLSDELERNFTALRGFKNAIFFNSLTERAIKDFE
jgi:uncharacterized protein (TIGR04255 family)